eukprot:CAMPEP_0197593704 /NCGR_PEP_ID=MMETSP1326-20131121/18829_1 /TAXON_ID=1155430 /ORGANISM="Genus nov. species nov., Strain RCC2288" /LENGTH=371 /DNA_ID=CAMNT_0043159737 /DNA_START=291 /DNA_END=1408 /DNA_ORIENTATION=-
MTTAPQLQLPGTTTTTGHHSPPLPTGCPQAMQAPRGAPVADPELCATARTQRLEEVRVVVSGYPARLPVVAVPRLGAVESPGALEVHGTRQVGDGAALVAVDGAVSVTALARLARQARRGPRHALVGLVGSRRAQRALRGAAAAVGALGTRKALLGVLTPELGLVRASCAVGAGDGPHGLVERGGGAAVQFSRGLTIRPSLGAGERSWRAQLAVGFAANFWVEGAGCALEALCAPLVRHVPPGRALHAGLPPLAELHAPHRAGLAHARVPSHVLAAGASDVIGVAQPALPPRAAPAAAPASRQASVLGLKHRVGVLRLKHHENRHVALRGALLADTIGGASSTSSERKRRRGRGGGHDDSRGIAATFTSTI